MWEMLSENEKIWITMAEDSSQITLHFKALRNEKSDIDEDYFIELPYVQWENMVSVAQKTKKYSPSLLGEDISKGDITVQWLAEESMVLIIGYFNRYFNAKTYQDFVTLLDTASEKIIKA